MAIISVSLSDENLESLDTVKDFFGLNGRSEAVRTAINAAMIEIQEIGDMEGPVEGILIVVRKEHADPWMSLIQARYQDDIRTQLHSHLKNHKCLEVMVMSSDSSRMSSMIKEIHLAGKADYVRFVRN